MRPGDVLNGFVLLPLLAALIGKDCHHIGCVYALDSDSGHDAGRQLRELVLREELVEMLDLMQLYFLCQLLIAEFRDTDLIVERVRLLHHLKSLFALDQEAVGADLEQNFDQILGDGK